LVCLPDPLGLGEAVTDVLKDQEKWDEGSAAADAKKTLLDCPYTRAGYRRRSWRRGFVHRYYEIHQKFP
jgi:hypothetical protein